MDHQEYACYEVKLNRIFNIQANKNLILFGVLLFLPVIDSVYGLLNQAFDWKRLILSVCGCFLIMVALLLSHPKYLEVTPETIKFQNSVALLNFLVTGRLWDGTGNDSKYSKSFTMYHIKSIQYLQTPFEKIFSCGHLQICGDVNLGGSGKEPRIITIYGVEDFESISAWMKDFVRIQKEA